MGHCIRQKTLNIVTVLIVLGAFTLSVNAVRAQGRPDSPGDPHAELETKLDELGGTAEGIDTKVAVLEGKADALEVKADSIQATVDGLVIPPPTDISGLQSDVTDIKSQNDALEVKSDSLEAKLDDLAIAIATPPTLPECIGTGLRFINRGLTVYDCQTDLEWEKKTPGNVDDLFTWSQGAPWNFDGTAADYINALNTVGFAGHNNWRLPMVLRDGGTAELETIVLPGAPNICQGAPPCIDPIFGPTAHIIAYWASVTSAASPNIAQGIRFDFGIVGGGPKDGLRYVRAVRSGP